MATVRSVFVGSQGIRYFWRVLIFFVLMVAFSACFQISYDHLLKSHLPPADDPVTIIVGDLLRAIAVLLATLVVVRAWKDRFADFGLPLREAFGGDFLFGMVWGFLNVSVVMGVLFLMHVYTVAGLAISGVAILKYALLWAAACLCIGLFEETCFRGYLFFGLARGIGPWPTAIALSLLFALAHKANPGETLIGLVGVFVIAMFICLTIIKTGSLWFPIGFHLAFDWGESFFYSVPDSGTPAVGHLLNAQLSGPKWLTGGSAGPEASVVMLVIEVMFFALFLAIHREDKLRLLLRKPRLDQAEAPAAAAGEVA